MKLEEAINVLDNVRDRPSLLVAADALLDVGQDEAADHLRRLADVVDHSDAREYILACVLSIRRHVVFRSRPALNQYLDALTLAQIADIPTRVLASQSVHDHRAASLLASVTNQVSVHRHRCYMIGIDRVYSARLSVGVNDGERCGSHTFTNQSRVFLTLVALNARLRSGNLPGNVNFLSDDEHKAIRSVRLTRAASQ